MEPITTLEVVLSRVIKDDGSMAVKIVRPTTYNSVELLGLLEAAKCIVFKEMESQL